MDFFLCVGLVQIIHVYKSSHLLGGNSDPDSTSAIIIGKINVIKD